MDFFFFFKVNKTRKEELKYSKKFNPQFLQHLGKLFSVQLNVVSVEERQKRRRLKRKLVLCGIGVRYRCCNEVWVAGIWDPPKVLRIKGK